MSILEVKYNDWGRDKEEITGERSGLVSSRIRESVFDIYIFEFVSIKDVEMVGVV